VFEPLFYAVGEHITLIAEFFHQAAIHRGLPAVWMPSMASRLPFRIRARKRGIKGRT
jgi:hypothetical protein